MKKELPEHSMMILLIYLLFDTMLFIVEIYLCSGDTVFVSVTVDCIDNPSNPMTDDANHSQKLMIMLFLFREYSICYRYCW